MTLMTDIYGIIGLLPHIFSKCNKHSYHWTNSYPWGNTIWHLKWSMGIQIELKKYFTVFHYMILSIFMHACYCLTNSKCILNKTRWCCAAIQVWVDIGLRKWPAAWQHQAIACTSADYRQPIQVNRIHSEIAFLLRTVSWETPRPPTIKICWRFYA